MLKNIFKRRRRSSKKERPSISSPQPVITPQSQSEPTVSIEATIEPITTRSNSIGTQAEFSPIRANPSLLTSSPVLPTINEITTATNTTTTTTATNTGTTAATIYQEDNDDDDEMSDPGYSTVRDALTNVNTAAGRSKHISDKRNKIQQPPPLPPPRREEEEEELFSDLTESDNDETQQNIQRQKINEDDRRQESFPIYAKVVKNKKQHTVIAAEHDHSNNNKKEVSFKHHHHQSTSPGLNNNENSTSDSEQDETIERSTSLPSHRPPIDPSSVHHSSRTQSLNLQSLNLSNLPIYNLNHTVPLASGDQAYLLTRIGPDGKEETFTATVLTPSPQKEKSSSIPATLNEPPQFITSTPLSRAQSLQNNSQPVIIPPNIQFSSASPPSNWVRKTKPVPFSNLTPSIKTSTSTQTDAVDQYHNSSLHSEQLKESLAQMTAELSTYSLNESETDLSALHGVPVEQLIQEIPGRLQNALKTLNETLASKESQLESYQNEVSKLKNEYKELTKANQRLTKVFKDQEELNKHEKTHLEHSLSAIEKEKESLIMETQSLKDKLKQSKNRHRTKVKELTEDLNKLSKERDSFRRDLLEVQSSHIATQSLIEKHSVTSSTTPTAAAPTTRSSTHQTSTRVTIPLDEHRKTLQEFESLLQDVVKTSKSQQKLNSLKKENESLVTQLNSMEEQCTLLRKEQRNYQERLLKLQSDLQRARSKELMITTELTQAMKMDQTASSSIKRLPSHHKSSERLYTTKPFCISAISKT